MEEIKFNNRENQKYTVKDSDGTEKDIYHNRAVTVDVFQYVLRPSKDENGDEINEVFVLVAERGPESHDYQGLLNVPCGHLDWDETVEEAGTREMFEETGFYNDNLTVLGVNSNPENNRQNVSIVLVGIVEVEIDEELPTLTGNGKESINPKWLPFVDYIKELEEKGIQPDKWAFNHDFWIYDITQKYFGLNQ